MMGGAMRTGLERYVSAVWGGVIILEAGIDYSHCLGAKIGGFASFTRHCLELAGALHAENALSHSK